jgi:phage terminase large subunit
MLQNIKINAEKAENPENGNTNTIRSVAHEVSDNDKRQRSLTRKAFQNLVLEKCSELERKTKSLMRKYDELSKSLTDNTRVNEVLPALRISAKDYKQWIDELETLYQQRRWGEFENEASLTREDSKGRFEKIYALISEATERQDSYSENGSQKNKTIALNIILKMLFIFEYGEENRDGTSPIRHSYGPETTRKTANRGRRTATSRTTASTT